MRILGLIPAILLFGGLFYWIYRESGWEVFWFVFRATALIVGGAFVAALGLTWTFGGL